MMKVLFISVVVLFLSVTTYSLLPNDAASADFYGSPAEFTSEDHTDMLYQASSGSGSLPFAGDCMPQPASVCLLTLCTLLLFNRKIRTPRPEIY